MLGRLLAGSEALARSLRAFPRLSRRFVRRFHAEVSRDVAAIFAFKSSRAAPKSIANRADVRFTTPGTSA